MGNEPVTFQIPRLAPWHLGLPAQLEALGPNQPKDSFTTIHPQPLASLLPISAALTSVGGEVSRNVISRSAAEEMILGEPILYTDHAVRGNILEISVKLDRQCKTLWREEVELSQVVTTGPDCNGDAGAVLLVLGAISFFVGLGVFFYHPDDKASSDPDDEIHHETPGTILMVLGGGGLATGVAMKIHCAQDPKTEIKKVGTETEYKSRGPYNCDWRDVSNTEVGLALASGTVLRAMTDDQGHAQIDLSGAEIEDMENMKLYIPKANHFSKLELSGQEREMLAYALAPKQARLGPVYSELKAKARHAAIQCYDNKFADHPMGGKIEVSVEVAPSGRVRKLSADFNPGSLSATNACIWDRMAELRFPKFEGDALAVRVPVTFEEPPPPPAPPRLRTPLPPTSFTAEELLGKPPRERPAARQAPPPEPVPEPKEPPKKVETVLVGGTPVTFVHDPSLGCTAGVAACQAAIMESGGCRLVRREASRAIGGLWGILAGAAAGAVCEQEMQEICAKAVCE